MRDIIGMILKDARELVKQEGIEVRTVYQIKAPRDNSEENDLNLRVVKVERENENNICVYVVKSLFTKF